MLNSHYIMKMVRIQVCGYCKEICTSDLSEREGEGEGEEGEGRGREERRGGEGREEGRGGGRECK